MLWPDTLMLGYCQGYRVVEVLGYGAAYNVRDWTGSCTYQACVLSLERSTWPLVVLFWGVIPSSTLRNCPGRLGGQYDAGNVGHMQGKYLHALLSLQPSRCILMKQ